MRAPSSFANRTAYLRPAREQSEKSTGTRMLRISRSCGRAREILEVFISSFHRWSCVNFRLRRGFDGNRRLAFTAQKLRNSREVRLRSVLRRRQISQHKLRVYDLDVAHWINGRADVMKQSSECDDLRLVHPAALCQTSAKGRKRALFLVWCASIRR